MLTQIEAFFAQHLSHYELFSDHMSHPVSRRITTVALVGLALLMCYKAVFQLGVWLGYWDIPGKEYFVDTPVHCAHVYVEAHVIVDGVEQLMKPLTYHIEFSPEEYNDENPDLGSTLGFLRKKCYFLFKDSSFYEGFTLRKTYTFDDVQLYKGDRLLVDDDKPLCLQGVETGNKLKVVYNL